MLRRSRVITTTTAVLALLVAACGDGGGGGAPVEVPEYSPPGPLSEAEQRYGIAPLRHPDVTYHPDVVMVGGGASSVRGLDDDGLTWRIDAGARDADELEVGKVMFLTNRAVGRVLALQRDGDELAVTLGPVDITEVITDGTFSLEEPVPFGDAASIDAGEPFWMEYDETEPADSVPGGTASGEIDGAAATTSAVVVPASFGPEPRPLAVPASRAAVRGAAGFGVRPRCCSDGVGANFTYDAGGVRIVGDVSLKMRSPRASFHLEIAGASVKRASLQISGAAALRIHVEAATQTGTNINKRLVVPVDFTVPIGQILGVPFAVTVNQYVGVQTAFSSKDGNISATGEWGIDKTLEFGYVNGRFGTVTGPSSLALRDSIVDSMRGISVGVTGIIVNHNARFNVGLGAAGFTAGLYFVLTTNAGLTIGSAAGAPFALCRGAQIGIWGRYGIGYTIPAGLVKAINAFLDLVNAKPIEASGGIEQVTNFFDKYDYQPRVPICRA